MAKTQLSSFVPQLVEDDDFNYCGESYYQETDDDELDALDERLSREEESSLSSNNVKEI